MPDEPEPSEPGWAAPTPPSPAEPPAAPTQPAPPQWGTQPVPPGWGTPPPPGTTDRPRRRRRWPWVLGAVLGTIVILAVSGTVLFIQKVKPPIDAANDFIDALKAGEVDAALDQMCAADRRTFDDDTFSPGLLGTTDLEVNFFGVSIDGDRATVDLTSDDFDDDTVFELPLRKEDGDWKPCLSDIELDLE